MHAMLTLTADPATRPLRADHVESAAAVLRSVGAEPGAPVVLAEGAAVDLPFDGAVPDAIAAALRAALSGLPADVNPQAAAGRRKRLLIADMDSTMITSESLDDLAEYAGIRDRVAPITARAMRGEIGFEDALRERVAMLAGQPAALLDRLLAERIELTAGAAALVATMRGGGAYAALVSGGFTFATGHVRRLVGFDEDRSNTLLLEGDRIAGRVGEPILGRDAKLATLRALCTARGLAPADALAVGDGANDLAMLGAAGMGVAFRAKPAVRDAARFRIEHGDLTGLLYLQGYREHEILNH